MNLSRRHFLSSASVSAAAAMPALGAATTPSAGSPEAASTAAGTAPGADWKITRGRIRQSVCHWCMKPLTVEELARGAAAMGLQSVELIGPEHWPVLKEHGLTCAIAGSHGFSKGFAHTEEHDECVDALRQSIDACAAHGVKNVITFSGFRRGLTDDVAMRNMIAGLKKIVPYAEEKNVTICLEMLNSRVDEEMKGHPDYWCDHIDLALEICETIASPRMKMLFDIYHVQIMDGDVIRRYRRCAPHVGHIHTAGNPGRHDLDDTQEIHYAGILQAIVESGYGGFVGQEFIPRGEDKLAALRQAARLCDV